MGGFEPEGRGGAAQAVVRLVGEGRGGETRARGPCLFGWIGNGLVVPRKPGMPGGL